MLYNTLKFLHILLTIIAVGYSMTFGLILSRAAKASQDGRELKYALTTVRLMSTIANVCFVLLALLGVGMVHLGGYSWAPMWIHGSAALFLITFALGIFVLGPMVKRRLAILESRGPVRSGVHQAVETLGDAGWHRRPDHADDHLADGRQTRVTRPCSFTILKFVHVGSPSSRSATTRRTGSSSRGHGPAASTAAKCGSRCAR